MPPARRNPMLERNRWSRVVGGVLVAASMTACPGDDDNDGEAELEAPEVEVGEDDDGGKGY
jgi:hypothetical protein